jgi:hypothetical protein
MLISEVEDVLRRKRVAIYRLIDAGRLKAALR